MKPKQFWLSLPVKDLQKSRAFYKEIGFTPNPRHEHSEEMASFFIGDNNFILTLSPEAIFKNFIKKDIADTKKGNEVLMNIDAHNEEEVDEMAVTVKKAGGTLFSGPETVQGWMYGFGFEDPDGHRWVVLHMDISQMPSEEK